MNGILNINKPSGITSHDVVYRLRRLLNEKKIGHTGTLDPDATGVLVMCLGKATKIIQFLEDDEKGYSGTITLGIRTDSLDARGKITEISDSCDLDAERIREVCNSFVGEIDQIPPMVSAIKIHGRKLYDIARQGKTIDRQPRRVYIYELEVGNIYKEKVLEPEIQGLFTKIDFSVRCSKGTYVRALAADIGNALNCGAHLSKLVRTKSGSFSIDNSISLDEIQADSQKAISALKTMDEALSFMPKIIIGDYAAKRFLNGVSIDRSDILSYENFCLLSEIPARVYDENDKFLGIGKATDPGSQSMKCNVLKVLSE